MERRPPLGEAKYHYRGYAVHKGYDRDWEAYTEKGTCVAKEKTLKALYAAIDSLERMRIPGDKRVL